MWPQNRFKNAERLTRVVDFLGKLSLTCPSTTLQVHPDLNQCGRQWGVMATPACLLHYWSETTGLVTYTCPIEDSGPVHLVYDGNNWVELSDFFRFCSAKWLVFLLSIKQASEKALEHLIPTKLRLGARTDETLCPAIMGRIA